MSTLHYVYAITRAAMATSIDREAMRGIDGTDVRAVVEGPFAAAVSQVDESDYGETPLNDHVRDLEWLTPRASAHQEVNLRLLGITDAVLPLSFGALYRDEPRVRDMLREDVATRTARLDEVAGRGEWVVTITREGPVADASADLATLDKEIAGSAPGRGYLLEKQRTRIATVATERADAEAARRALDVLSDASERVFREPVPQGGDPVVIRLSILAARADGGALDGAIDALARELGDRGYRVRANGPWPAYRFGSLA